MTSANAPRCARGDRPDAAKGKWLLAGLAVLVALWLGLTAPSQSPVAPTPLPVMSAGQPIVSPELAPAPGVTAAAPTGLPVVPAPRRRH